MKLKNSNRLFSKKGSRSSHKRKDTSAESTQTETSSKWGMSSDDALRVDYLENNHSH